jgi:hypothetical protein
MTPGDGVDAEPTTAVDAPEGAAVVVVVVVVGVVFAVVVGGKIKLTEGSSRAARA